MTEEAKRSIVKAYDDSSGFWLKKSRVSDRFLELIRSDLGHEDAALDLGTGGGRMAFLLADGARRIVGADLSTALIEGAKEKARSFDPTNLRFVQGDLEDPHTYERCIEENEGRPFDMAISNVLIRKDACRIGPVLENCRVAVKDGGLLLFRIESSGDLPEMDEELPCYSLEEVRSSFERYGYRIDLMEEERFSQRFSGIEAFRDFLERTGLSHHLTTDGMDRALIRARSLEGKDGVRMTRSYHLFKAARD